MKLVKGCSEVFEKKNIKKTYKPNKKETEPPSTTFGGLQTVVML